MTFKKGSFTNRLYHNNSQHNQYKEREVKHYVSVDFFFNFYVKIYTECLRQSCVEMEVFL